MSVADRVVRGCTVLALVISAGSVCEASLIRFQFSGVVTAVPSHFAEVFSVGEGVSGTYAFDFPASDASPLDCSSLYQGIIRDASLSFDSGYTARLGALGTNQIWFGGDCDGWLDAFDKYTVSFPLVSTSTTATETLFDSLALDLWGSRGWLPSPTLSETPPDISQAFDAHAQLRTEEGYFGLDILTLTRVPEPPSLLLITGLLCSCLLLRRRESNELLTDC